MKVIYNAAIKLVATMPDQIDDPKGAAAVGNFLRLIREGEWPNISPALAKHISLVKHDLDGPFRGKDSSKDDAPSTDDALDNGDETFPPERDADDKQVA